MNRISSKHFILFIVGVSLISLKTYPSIFINIGGRDTWISTIIAAIVFVAILIYIVNIMFKTNSYDINDIFIGSMPKLLGLSLLYLFSITLFVNALESAAVEVNALHSTLFLQTPVWYALIFFLFPTFFIFSKKLRTLLIFVLVCTFFLIINSILFILFSQKYANLDNLLPVLENGLSLNLFTTSLYILGCYSVFMISIPYLRYIYDYKNIRKHSFQGGIIVAVISVASIISIITAFGPLRVSNIFYPEFILSQRLEFAGFIEFGEMFFLIQTVLGFFIKYILSTYSLLIIFHKYIKNKPVFIGIYSFIVFSLAVYFGANNYYLYYLLKYLQIINLIGFIFIPLIVFSFYKISYNKKNKKKEIKLS
ncbi:endospore germination permease [Clostridium sp.]|uniref:endospore germination permease n=1 Tax=Clostridium sp. TaxID=1506 RepID=UPI00263507B3|nr:endospore germination permease [Clostridium sp.]